MASIAPIRKAQNADAQECLVCVHQGNCLSGALEQSQRSGGLGLGRHQVCTNAEEGLYWAGEAFQNIYSVRSGCLKTCTVDSDGNEHIRAFHLPGDLVGLDALSGGSYPSSAIAVVPSEVCVISYAQLTRQVSGVPALQQRMFEMISQQLCTSLALAGDFTAEQRMAAFLLHLYQRLARRGMASGGDIRLAMPRRDIAAYLRLAMETVSRALGRFERDGWIEVSVRDVRLHNLQALWKLAEPVGICEAPAALSMRTVVPARRLAAVQPSAQPSAHVRLQRRASAAAGASAR